MLKTPSLLLAATLALASQTFSQKPPNPPAKRWLYLSSNLLVDANIPKNTALLQRAKAAGYNGVLFTDYKTGFWWNHEIRERYEKNAQAFRAAVRDLGLELAVAVMPFGYAGSWLAQNPNLAAGISIRDCPLVVENGVLKPVPTAELKNGSFEEHSHHKVAGASYQDDPGSVSFVDDQVKHGGQVSLRLSPKAGGPENVRVFYKLKVQPWQHYRIRCWTRANKLNADAFRIAVLGNGRSLQWQYAVRQEDQRLARFEQAKELSFDWVQQLVDFNSLGHGEVSLVIGLWGAKSGDLWLDDVVIESAPTLNLLRRDDLSLILKTGEGQLLQEGKDVELVSDPNLGRLPYAGEYSSRGEIPAIRLTKNSRLQEGQRVTLSGWHPHVIHDGQVNCSMLHPEVWKIAQDQIANVTRLFQPDMLFLSHDEIRSMGWEPAEQAFADSGAILAENIKRSQDIARKAGGGRPLMVWSDMFDPGHNALPEYYLARGSVAGSWTGLQPDTWIMKWGEAKADQGLTFFQSRGHKTMVAAFYDHDVTEDAAAWKKTLQNTGPIEGVMYTTWTNDYSQLEAFAKLWWPE
jgi:hypothetical protein